MYAGLCGASAVVTAYPAGESVTAFATVSALYPFGSQLCAVVFIPSVFGTGNFIDVTVLLFVFNHWSFVDVVPPFSPDFTVIVLLYTAYNVFGTLYAGLCVAFVVVTAYPAGVSVTAFAVVSGLYPNGAHPVAVSFSLSGASILTADTVLLYVFNF